MQNKSNQIPEVPKREDYLNDQAYFEAFRKFNRDSMARSKKMMQEYKRDMKLLEALASPCSSCRFF
jgi:hypothetical protein